VKNLLTRRGGIWWARLVVPAVLREAASRREFNKSTRTHQIEIAKTIAAVLVADWRRQLLALKATPLSVDILKIVRPFM
jgi:hypothetical protein